MPKRGVGSLKALAELVAAADVGATRSTGPRFFHFVMGGVTPAALGADWLTSTLNQSAYNWVSSPLASRIEQVTLGWLKELFGIPAGWSAVMTSAATTANLVGLDSARRWWGLEHGVDVDERGLAGLPEVPVFGSGYLHASAVKALGVLGLGRTRPQTFARDDGAMDAAALERARRARAIPVWATLRAYGLDGYRDMIERHLGLAQRVARQVDDAPDLERLADVPLNVVCFRYRPDGVDESELDELNRKLGAMVLEDGRVYFVTTEHRGKLCFRPAIVNWRTTEKDVDLIVEVVRELGSRLVIRAPGR